MVYSLCHRIERLYEVFECYPLNPAMCYSPFIVREALGGMAIFTRKNLRELSADDLSTYSVKALTTWGTVEDFKYFLPRLLALCADDVFYRSVTHEPIDAWLTCGKLRYANWTTWNPIEVQAITLYLESLWRAALAQTPYEADLALAYSAIANTGISTADYLHYWQNLETINSYWHLAYMLKTGSCIMPSSKNTTSERALYEFLEPQKSIKLLETVFFEHMEHASAADISEAIQTYTTW